MADMTVPAGLRPVADLAAALRVLSAHITNAPLDDVLFDHLTLDDPRLNEAMGLLERVHLLSSDFDALLDHLSAPAPDPKGF